MRDRNQVALPIDVGILIEKNDPVTHCCLTTEPARMHSTAEVYGNPDPAALRYGPLMCCAEASTKAVMRIFN